MAYNPLISVGTLNRLIASVIWPSFPALTVTAPFLNKDGIRLAIDGEATKFLPAMVGAVPSPEPYQLVTMTINLLKTQPLAALYKAQYESSTLLGNCTVYPDSAALPAYQLSNVALESVRELNFSGEDAGWVVVSRGTYYVNSTLWP
jgi:hypothetical protein